MRNGKKEGGRSNEKRYRIILAVWAFSGEVISGRAGEGGQVLGDIKIGEGAWGKERRGPGSPRRVWDAG